MDTNTISGGTACPLWRSLRAVWDRVWKSQRRSYGFRRFHGWEINLEIRKSGKESEQAGMGLVGAPPGLVPGKIRLAAQS